MSFRHIVLVAYSYFYIAFIGISSMIMVVIGFVIRLLTFPFDPRRVAVNLFSSFWASLYIWLMPFWSVQVINRKKLDMKKSYVMVSNHQSQLDILVVYQLYFPLRWISKAAVFRLPFIGWHMLNNGDVKLKRGDKESIRQMMEQCEKLLAQNVSIMIFPEGTRTRTGRVKPFKPGAFILAKKMKKSIVPLVINNTKNALPKYSLVLQGRHKMTVEVLDEIPYEQFAHMEVNQIADMVREMIISRVNEHAKSA